MALDRKRLRLILWMLVVLLGLVLRAILLAHPAEDDILHFEETARIAQRGGNIYVEQYYYNYSPLISQIIRFLPAPFAITLRILLGLSDLVVALFTAWLAPSGMKLAGFAAFWCNPATVYITGVSGQFETLALLPLFWAVLAARRKQGPLIIWTLCVLSLLTKHVLLFQIWALFVGLWGWRKATLRLMAALAVFAFSFIPYLPDAAPRIWERVITYSSWTGSYGLGLLLPVSMNALLFYAVMVSLPLIARWRKFSVDTSLTLSFLAFPVFTHGMNQKLFVPTLAWLSIRPGLTWMTLTISLSTIYVVSGDYWFVAMATSWLACGLLFLSEFRRSRSRDSSPCNKSGLMADQS